MIKNELRKFFWVGLFIICALILLAWLLLFLRPSVGDDKVTLHVRFSNIERITKGTRVTFAGKPVGQVEKVIEIQNPREGAIDDYRNIYLYELILKVDSSVHIFTYDEIVLASSGLLGEKSIAIIPKAPPPLALAAQEVTNQVLYAHSMDKLEQTFLQVQEVASTFETTLSQLNELMQNNTESIHKTLDAIAGAGTQLEAFLSEIDRKQFVNKMCHFFDQGGALLQKANQDKFVERMTQSFDSIGDAAYLMTHGEGTVSRLINSDAMYLQLSATLNKFDQFLYNLNNYGLLFQFNRQWQRSHTDIIERMGCLCTPRDFYRFGEKQMNHLARSLEQMGQLVKLMECRGIPLQNSSFLMNFEELFFRMEQLQCLINQEEN